jgi:predicted enzyme related to lactoylglutathione lyase
MDNNITFVHTNIIARDWKKLSQFYIDVFKCKPLYPERNLSGEWIDKITGIHNVQIEGIHLAMPGYENGSTLEIFSYKPEHLSHTIPAINQQGLGHLAFHVESVPEVVGNVIANGGAQMGEVIIKQYDEIGTLTAAYARDPEGNIIEIQNWKK